MAEPYQLYGGELSLFTRKLEAALIFYGAAFEFYDKGDNDPELIEQRSGTHQVPVLKTPENWMIADTTPIIAMLDGRFPERRLFPGGADGALVHVLEEHFDEWIARVMVHYRWHYPESADFAAERISNGHPERAASIKEWGPRACRATGTASEHQQAAAEAEYERMLAAAEAQLRTTPFLLGDRPTALDCIVLGGLRAHTNMDPTPKRTVARYPAVVAWAEGGADAWDGRGALLDLADCPFAQHVLGEMAETYGRFVLANRDAIGAGAKAFHCESYDEEVSYLTRPYPERSRHMVAARLASLSENDLTKAQGWLEAASLTSVFT